MSSQYSYTKRCQLAYVVNTVILGAGKIAYAAYRLHSSASPDSSKFNETLLLALCQAHILSAILAVSTSRLYCQTLPLERTYAITISFTQISLILITLCVNSYLLYYYNGKTDQHEVSDTMLALAYVIPIISLIFSCRCVISRVRPSNTHLTPASITHMVSPMW
ncbi:MAG: hypothetical protein MHMPM18_004922 [Marteilia pararefringens]